MEVAKNIIQVTPTKLSRIDSVDFDNIAFGRLFSDHMLEANYSHGEWTDVSIRAYSRLSLAPSVSALHYGQSIFEGMKAYKSPEGAPLLFRPDRNYQRMNFSADRLCMPPIPRDIFMDGLRQLVKLDQQWIPTQEGASLYIRPFYFATDEYVGIKPSDNYKFVIFSCPVNAYYPEPVGLMVTSEFVRAFPGGTGEAKAAGNYAASLLGGKQAKAHGYDNVLWLDGMEHRYVEECGTMNVFFIIDGVAVTPHLDGAVLHGTTREAVMVLLEDMGVPVEARQIDVVELWDAYEKGTLEEIFGTGTAATIAHVDRLGHDGTVARLENAPEIVLPPIKDRKIGPKLLKTLNGIRTGKIEDKYGWVEQV